MGGEFGRVVLQGASCFKISFERSFQDPKTGGPHLSVLDYILTFLPNDRLVLGAKGGGGPAIAYPRCV